MTDTEWYEISQGPALMQGEILRNCPVLLQTIQPQWPMPPQAELEVKIREYDLVVMTHSCDLANDKVQEVLLAKLVAWTDAVEQGVRQGNEFIKSAKFRRQLIDGTVPSLSLFHKREEEPKLPWSVVDFHRLFVLPKTFVTQFAGSTGPRLRLRSPYREHLAQHFAAHDTPYLHNASLCTPDQPFLSQPATFFAGLPLCCFLYRACRGCDRGNGSTERYGHSQLSASSYNFRRRRVCIVCTGQHY